jgi:hypothetical protein
VRLAVVRARRRRFGPAVVVLASAVLTGCTCAVPDAPDGAFADVGLTDAPPFDGGEADTGTLTPVSLEDLCETIVNDICLTLTECLERDYADAEHCAGDQICARMSDLEMEIAAGWATYDAAAAAECDARFRADPCNFGLFLFVPTVHEVLAYCPDVVTGVQATGDPCASDLDCSPVSFCSMMGRTCPGTCQPRVSEGGACTSDGTADCDWSLTCRRDVCQRRLIAGDACDSTTRSDCYNDGYWCDVAAGVCRDPVGEGEPCDDLGGARCASPLVCVQVLGDVGTCRIRGSAGAECDDDRDCVDILSCYQPGAPNLGACRAPASEGQPCVTRADCAEAYRCASDLCVPLDTLGEPCVSEFGADTCAAGLICADGTCHEDRFPGDACDDGIGACVLALCRSGVCTSRSPLGAACTIDDDCASRFCSSLVCADRAACL